MILRGAVAALAMIAAAGVAAAETPARRAIDEDHPGYLPYRKYCAACHGVFADGRGPVAPVLKTPPADLSRLAEKYGLPLPKGFLAEFIDGRRWVRAHGAVEMPVWGERLFEEVPDEALAEWARGRTIESIVEYLVAIQRPPPETNP